MPVGAAQLWVRRVSTPRDSLSDRVLHGSALRHGACRRVRESTLGGACEPLTPGLGGLGRSKCITSSKLLQSLKTHHPAPHSALKQESSRPRQKLWARPQPSSGKSNADAGSSTPTPVTAVRGLFLMAFNFNKGGGGGGFGAKPAAGAKPGGFSAFGGGRRVAAAATPKPAGGGFNFANKGAGASAAALKAAGITFGATKAAGAPAAKPAGGGFGAKPAGGGFGLGGGLAPKPAGGGFGGGFGSGNKVRVKGQLVCAPCAAASCAARR